MCYLCAFFRNDLSMKKTTLFITLFIMGHLLINAQNANDFANLERYREQNAELISSEKKIAVVFMGNSITEGWVAANPDFFTSNNYVGRGISGQTSSQMLLRFQSDVIALKPKVVVINAGTNDIALNAGTYNQDLTLNNIKSMAEIAEANGIKVILTSVLPAGAFSWRPEITDAAQKVDALNNEIRRYAKSKGFAYVDYNSAMRDNNGAMLPQLGNDGIHPNAEGYKVMERVIMEKL